MRTHVFETAAGFCGIAWEAGGIARFALPASSAGAAERQIARRAPGAEPGTPPAEVAAVIAAVRRYFAGEPVDFRGARLAVEEPDPFTARVYAAVRALGWGETTTYGALAKALGAGPEAARDVGQAMARNPLPLLIPCHRVLAAGGRLGGFSAPGGAGTKRRMLEMEGVALAPPAPAQAAFAF
jgi:methylated-DNA-[protein]-cysteine S-methyltransferase